MTTLPFLPADSEMGRRIGAFDWASTAVGAPEHWNPALKAVVRIALTTQHPMFVFWGPALTCFYNDAYSRSLGPEKHPSILGIPAAAAWPEIWHIIGPQIEYVMRGEGATWHENHLVPIERNGRIEDVYWTYSYSPIHDEAAPNGIGGILVICTETTEQVRTAQRLTLERTRLAEIFEQAPAFMTVLRGPNHVIELANPGYMALIGHRDVVGRPVAEALPEVIEQGFVDLLDQVYRTGEPFSAYDSLYLFPGTGGAPPAEKRIDFVYQPLRDATGAVDGIFVIGVDVTERRTIEQQLRQAEARMRLAVESSSLGTFDVDLDARTVVLSPNAAAIFALESRPTLAACIERVAAEDRAMVEAAVAAARDHAGDGQYRVKHRVRRPDGTVRWVDVSGRRESASDEPASHRSGSLTGVLWDVTEQESLLAALRDADTRKDHFLAVLSHELRNPLAPIRNAAAILAQGEPGADRHRWCGEVIERHTANMSRLLDDLLEVSRITTGKLQLKITRVDLRSVLEAAVDTARPAIEARDHRLEITLPPQAVEVDVDPLRIAQAVTNLLTNAAKYTDVGGRIALRAAVEGERAVIEVADDGFGIPADALPTIFTLFGQVDATRNRAEGGLGIGLALSRGLVELHHGRISVTSDGVGRGSIFRIELPIVARADADRATRTNGIVDAPTAVANDATALSILVADDNEDGARSLAMLLELQGHRVHVACDGHEAVRLATEVRPRVAILDIGMPGLDGYAVARRLRASPRGDEMLLIAATGWGQAEDKRRALGAGFDAHLVKPVSFEHLRGFLESITSGASRST